jgi:hypothetical protein
MNTQDICRFVAAQGMRSFEGKSCLWVEKRKLFFESVPGHRRIQVEAAETMQLFRRGAAAIRYTCNEEEGVSSFEYVCDDPTFGMASLAPDARRRVRRGLELCDVRPVEFEQLASEGAQINRSVFARQGRAGQSVMADDDLWRRYMTTCGQLGNIQAFGAFVAGKLCGFSIAIYVDEYCYLFHTHAYSESMKFSPINALTFTVMKTALERPEIRCVSQGLESLVALPEVERFKLSMGFRKRPLGRRVLLSPWARPVFSTPGTWIFRRILKRLRPDLIDDFSTLADALHRQRCGAVI